MAITFDAALGSVSKHHTGTTDSFATSAAAASGTWGILGVSYWDGGVSNGRLTGVSDPGGAWTRDKQFINGDDIIELWHRDLPSGLANPTTISLTFSPTFGGGLLCSVASFAGITAFDTSSSASSTGNTANAGTATNAVADSLFFGAVGIEDTTSPTTTTPVNGTELHDLYFATDQQGLWTAYTIATTIASGQINGTESNANSTANTGALAIYSGTAGAAAPPPILVMAPPLPST